MTLVSLSPSLSTPTFQWHYLWAALLFIGLNTCNVTGQERTALTGKITTDSVLTTAVNIVNLTAKTGTISHDNGRFTVYVKRGDSLLFSSMIYAPHQLKITDSILAQGRLTVQLKTAINTLATVHLNSSGLSGNLSKDLEEVGYFDQADVGFPGTITPRSSAERRFHAATSGGLISALINRISGRTKHLKKLLKQQLLTQRIYRLVDQLGEDFFTESLGLSKDDIYRFMYFVAAQKDYHQQFNSNTPLDLRAYLKRHSIAFKRAWREKKTTK